MKKKCSQAQNLFELPVQIWNAQIVKPPLLFFLWFRAIKIQKSKAMAGNLGKLSQIIGTEMGVGFGGLTELHWTNSTSSFSILCRNLSDATFELWIKAAAAVVYKISWEPLRYRNRQAIEWERRNSLQAFSLSIRHKLYVRNQQLDLFSSHWSVGRQAIERERRNSLQAFSIWFDIKL